MALQRLRLLHVETHCRAPLRGPAFGMFAACALAGCAVGNTAVHEPTSARMTTRDAQLADAAVQRALESQPSGSALAWRNETSGHSGSVRPLRTYRASNGLFCREFEEIVELGGGSERHRDVACRADPGVWQLVPVTET